MNVFVPKSQIKKFTQSLKKFLLPYVIQNEGFTTFFFVMKKSFVKYVRVRCVFSLSITWSVSHCIDINFAYAFSILSVNFRICKFLRPYGQFVLVLIYICSLYT